MPWRLYLSVADTDLPHDERTVDRVQQGLHVSLRLGVGQAGCTQTALQVLQRFQYGGLRRRRNPCAGKVRR